MPHENAFLGLDPRSCGLPARLSEDIELVDRMLGALLHEQEDHVLLDVARSLYKAPAGSGLATRIPELDDPRFVQRLLRAYTVLFQLINTAEQKEIVRANAERSARAAGAPGSESIAEAITKLRDSGVPAAEMQQLIARLDICPTLTAHPTEARRRSVLDKLQTLAETLLSTSADGGSPERARSSRDRAVLRMLTALWQTDELRASALTVADEAVNILYFFEHSILEIVAWLHEDLRSALARSYPGETFDLPPFVHYRSWVGGDRDGNPNVTPDITWQTVIRHQSRVLDHYLRCTEAVRRELSLSARLVPVSDALLASLESDRAIELTGRELKRYRLEPYALKLLYMQARLRATRDRLDGIADFRVTRPNVVAGGGGAKTPLRGSVHGIAYQNAAAFLEDLLIIRDSLRENRGRRLADEGTLAHLITQAMTFGFHLATLDIRQHSEEHERAIDEMLLASGVLPADKPYSTLGEVEKVRLLQTELANPRPLLATGWKASAETRNVLEVFDVVREAQRELAPDAIDTYIISMTHGVSDILEVLLLAKEAGLLRWRVEADGRHLESDLDVVPLFETIDDLQRCDGFMRELFEDPAYRAHLKARGTFQEIMLGYSDSSKDGGFLAANCTLFDTQARLAAVCTKAGVAVRFFHGRGGTVGRGGGRANRAILSQPAGSFDGSIRFTEQGEVISFRYGVLPLGHRHMEQIVNAALLAASNRTSPPPIRDEWRQALREMAQHSLQAYREFVHEDAEFWTFYRQATPIQHISRLPIASRPASRARQPTGLDALRAIPWVFAWVQSRYVIPGWYGLGSGLEAWAKQGAGNAAMLSEMYRDWLFFRMVVNNAQLELLRAHLPTAARYAARVEPRALGTRVHERIAREHALSRDWILRITGQKDLLEHAPVVRRTVELRNPALAPLSLLQIALLDRLEEDMPEDARAAWQEAMLLSITGIAAAMQSTG
jgi:phosphoenolpyruvate carboxylase